MICFAIYAYERERCIIVATESLSCCSWSDSTRVWSICIIYECPTSYLKPEGARKFPDLGKTNCLIDMASSPLLLLHNKFSISHSNYDVALIKQRFIANRFRKNCTAMFISNGIWRSWFYGNPTEALTDADLEPEATRTITQSLTNTSTA